VIGDVVIVGCGNLLRGDDAAGPMLVRKILEFGCPAGVRLVDGGTSGLDVALQMAGAREAIIVDACSSGSTPGDIFELPGDEVAVPPLAGMNLHAFRWDSAIAFACRLLGERYPKKVTVLLIEAQTLDYGAPLSEPAAKSVDALARDLIARYTSVEPQGAT
jgi:hydrogenase maturation protease